LFIANKEGDKWQAQAASPHEVQANASTGSDETAVVPPEAEVESSVARRRRETVHVGLSAFHRRDTKGGWDSGFISLARVHTIATGNDE
jgi:hypothetical protein